MLIILSITCDVTSRESGHYALWTVAGAGITKV